MDSCAYFSENPAEEHFVQGIAASLSDDQLPRAMAELEKAIALGLPEDSEMEARFFLGGVYRQVATGAGLPVAELVRTTEFSRALNEQQRAVRIDHDADYGYFALPQNRILLRSFDSLCVLRGRMIGDEQGQNAAIAFLEENIRLCDHLPTSPLLQMLLDLGNLYFEAGAKDRAASCFERIIHAEPVDRADETGSEGETRTMAANNLRIATGQGAPARSTGSGCMVIVAVFALILLGAWSLSVSL